MTRPSDTGSTGWVAGVERWSTRVGPGIRTTVFFKGCPLRCAWCSSPETWRSHADLYFRLARCQRCGACLSCPESAIDLEAHIDRARCTLCMACVDTCPHGALQRIGKLVSDREVVEEVARDTPFYDGGGGATLSGGEPLVQPEFLARLVQSLRTRDISVVLDTSGHGPPQLLDSLLPLLDLVLFDIKHMDPERHRTITGVGNELILFNARRVARHGKLRISFPLVPGLNDDDQNVEATGAFARETGAEWVDIMPLHRLGEARYAFLGLPSPYAPFPELLDRRIATVKDMLVGLGLRVTIGRMM